MSGTVQARTRAAAVGAGLTLALLASACGAQATKAKAKVTTTTTEKAASTTTTSTTSTTEPGSTTTGPGSPGAVTTDDVKAVLTKYFTAYFSGNASGAYDTSDYWAYFLAKSERWRIAADGSTPTSTVSPDVSITSVGPKAASSKPGTTFEATGTVVITNVPYEDPIDGNKLHAVTFSDFELVKNKQLGLVLADFTATPADKNGQLQGRLSDQIGYLSKNTVKAGDLDVTMDAVFRTAGYGPTAVQIDLSFHNAGTATYKVLGGLSTSFRVDGQSGSMPTDGVHVPAIGPSKDTIGYLVFNQPSSFNEGKPTVQGTLIFTVVDGAGKRQSVELPVPAFPAKYDL
ncbi:MAG: hypothetical protein JWM05_1531 [Acidimicrobiales bacterium]|nr:hypothetical protein [Acidimicrobiales bacterium]